MPRKPHEVVILAAGQGLRIRKDEQDYLKPLYPLGGRPLLSHVFEALTGAGVRKLNVVVGFCSADLVPGVRSVVPEGAEVQFIDNPDWKLSNGISLLCARGAVQGPFLLSMADHLYRSEVVERLVRGAADPDSLYLGVDRKLDSIFDMDDATKVRTEGGCIVEIGKHLTRFDCVDTGLFVCPPAVFDYLETARQEGGGDCSLSAGVQAMARDGRARVVDIGDAFWQDVDTAEMLAHAEAWLAERG
jgi:choline kinase